MIISILSRIENRFLLVISIIDLYARCRSFAGVIPCLDASVLCLMQWSPVVGPNVAGKLEPRVMASGKVWMLMHLLPRCTFIGRSTL